MVVRRGRDCGAIPIVMDRERWFSVATDEGYKTDYQTTEALPTWLPFHSARQAS